MNKSKKQKLKKKAAKKLENELSQLERQKLQEKITTLIEEAETAIDSFNYDEAELKVNEILNYDPVNVKALEMSAGIQIEKFNWIEAQNLLKKCTELSPDEGFSKYFSLGQLYEGEESLAYYQKGIKILEKELEDSENVEPTKGKDKTSLVRALSDAYCSISEIYMTDCCFAENAEEKCYNAIEAALKADPTNPESYQCLCNFHLVKEQINEAKEDMDKCLSLWLPHHESLRDGEADAASENIIPSYDSRIKIAKLLIELEMFDEGAKVLDGLIEEDDEVVEVWYLLGWMNYIQGHEYKLNAHYYLTKAKKIIEKTKMEHEDYIVHIHELLEELSAIVPADDDIEEEERNDDNWESDLSSDSENENKMET